MQITYSISTGYLYVMPFLIHKFKIEKCLNLIYLDINLEKVLSQYQSNVIINSIMDIHKSFVDAIAKKFRKRYTL